MMVKNMGILSAASFASVVRGYDYYKGKKVISWERINDHVFAGGVEGSYRNSYQVVIDVEHPRKSTCNCPHAEGKMIVCKHKVALFFTVFPNEAEEFIEEVEAYEKEQEELRQERYDEVRKYVNSLSKAELREALFNKLTEEEDDYY